jgi:hypothetical protein
VTFVGRQSAAESTIRGYSGIWAERLGLEATEHIFFKLRWYNAEYGPRAFLGFLGKSTETAFLA